MEAIDGFPPNQILRDRGITMGKFHCQVVGLQHHMSLQTIKGLASYAEETPLRMILEREPTNVHDENAIKVLINDKRLKSREFGPLPYFIGYLPRRVAAVMATGLDNGTTHVLRARLVSVDIEHMQAKALISVRKTAGKQAI